MQKNLFRNLRKAQLGEFMVNTYHFKSANSRHFHLRSDLNPIESFQDLTIESEPKGILRRIKSYFSNFEVYEDGNRVLAVEYNCKIEDANRVLLRVYTQDDSREVTLLPSDPNYTKSSGNWVDKVIDKSYTGTLIHNVKDLKKIDVILEGDGNADLQIYKVWITDKFDPQHFRDNYPKTTSFHDLSTVDYAERCKEFTQRCKKDMIEIIARNKLVGSVGQDAIEPFVYFSEDMLFPYLIGNANAFSWYVMEDYLRNDLSYFRQVAGGMQSGQVVFDCGSHTGYNSRYFREIVGSSGRVFSFDPFEQNNYLNKLNAEFSFAPEINVVGGGVSIETKHINADNERQMVTENNETNSAPAIQVYALDDFYNEKPNFIKFDIEGHEADALFGAQKILHDYKPSVYIELHPQFLPDFGRTYLDVFNAFPKNKYDLIFESHEGNGTIPFEKVKNSFEHGVLHAIPK